jgi:hypothetical protein
MTFKPDTLVTFDQGFHAYYYHNEPKESNPYNEDSEAEQCDAWDKGWESAWTFVKESYVNDDMDTFYS